MAVLALLPAGAVHAQDIPFSPDATESCLAVAADPEACVGLSSDDCMATPDGQSTVGMGFCLGRELNYWDGRLNAAYAALMQIEAKSEAELKELGSAALSPAAALRDMQRAWIGYRDAACLYEESQWGGGTGGGPAATACSMRLTAEQALALEDRLRVATGP